MLTNFADEIISLLGKTNILAQFKLSYAARNLTNCLLSLKFCNDMRWKCLNVLWQLLSSDSDIIISSHFKTCDTDALISTNDQTLRVHL